MNQSKDKPSTVLIPVKEANDTFNNIAKEIQNTVSTDDTEILDKGGGGKDSS